MSSETGPVAQPPYPHTSPDDAVAAVLRPVDRAKRLSHDLRTPLNGIIGFAELIRDGKAGPVTETQREFLGDILESARQLGRLLDQALGLSRQAPRSTHASDVDKEDSGMSATSTLADSRPQPATEVILLVDDEDEMRALERESLEAAGYTVLEARDGDEALLVADWHDGPIHLVITDVMMPHVDGGELVRRLPAVRADVRVLYVSGYASNTVADSGGPVADTAFLAKPFTPAALVEKVREVLARPAAS